MALIQVDNVTKDYQLGHTQVQALRGVSLRVEPGQFLVIAGPSGSGKSTMLHLIGVLDQPSSGAVHVAGRDTAQLTPDQQADLRATSLGFIFQTFNLLPVLTAFENVEYPMLRRKGSSRAERRARVMEVLAAVGIAELADRYPSDMSGGQRQRVAIARALVHRPQCVLADEPTANLDHATGLAIIDLMTQLKTQLGTAFVISSHDPKVIARVPWVIHMEDGKVSRRGTSPLQ